MDGKKVLEVVSIYRNFFETIGVKEGYSPHDEAAGKSTIADLSHCCGMLGKIEEFVIEERMDKAFRWLGFIQGCLWSYGLYTLDDLKNHNKPNSENES